MHTIGEVPWGEIFGKSAAPIVTACLLYLAKVGRSVLKFVKSIDETTKRVPVVEDKVEKLDAKVAKVESDLTTVRSEVARRHVENREQYDSIRDHVKTQGSIAQSFERAIGVPLREIADTFKRERGAM